MITGLVIASSPGNGTYVPEEELKAAEIDEESGEDDGLSLDIQETEYMCQDETEIKEAQSYQNSPVSTATNQDAGYGSPFSENSDQLAHFKSSSSKEEKEDHKCLDNASYPQDSLAQIKAVYANLLSESCWSGLALDLKKSKNNEDSPKESTTNSTTSISTPNTSASTSTNTTTTTSISSTSNSSSGSSGYDWHQAALAKTLQQTSYGLLPEPSLFSTVQLYRQNNKLYGSVFTGASKFRCKDCSAAYDTLVELTVHMNETGHYRDDNQDKESEKTRRWSKPRKRSLMEMEGKEDAQKVLKCMYCGHSFESLQDLSVHMIKTKHYQKVPLKEPVPAITKLVPSTKKRALQDLASPCSPEPTAITSETTLSEAAKDQKTANPYVTPNNRYGYQNGASYTWQFEARKAQILKCMECGSSHDTLQQLTAHMMVTGHFLKVTNSASKKGKQLVLDSVVEEKIQSIPLPPTAHTRLPATNIKKQPDSPAGSTTSEEKKEPEKEQVIVTEMDKKIKEENEDSSEKIEPTAVYQYLREEDLDESPKGGIDILKSLENTVTTAISKAQNGAPSWGGYPSIHAAYQLPGTVKSLQSTVQSVQIQPSYASSVKSLSSEHSALIHSPGNLTPPPHKSNVSAMEELVEKVTGKIHIKKEEKPSEKEKCSPVKPLSPAPKESKDFTKSEESNKQQQLHQQPLQQKQSSDAEVQKVKKDVLVDPHALNGTEPPKAKVTNGCNNLGIITDHSPEQSFINPLSALQSIMNTHLGKVSNPVNPSLDPLAMLYKISNSMLDKPIYPTTPAKQAESIDRYYYENSDQPIDLTKSKTKPLISSVTDSVSSPLRESALMDISDMVKNLTGRLTPKSSTPSSVSEKSDADGSSFEEALDELSPVHKRKGRQSNWNPQHLLILQAQFASSLRETPEGKYIMSDLGPQERVHISKFTGLSMTTISHWLANVKYQLRRTGGTKFLKNLDTGHPVFFCNDCASQFRTASTYISHLETHLGFSLKDLSKLPLNQIQEQQNVSKVLSNKTLGSLGIAEEDSGSTFQCKLCNRTFASKHAVKLHLSKTHGKSPEDHLIYVTELEKH
ncbi:teashirt homolog 1 isoform X1 [Ahaetulla prasina]|uniref:teashirt homolog 1 isoform X1 n=2 Tax=Ahaetulla prasina TaxID=499056 RepID=UPI002648381D|nr:teashirt homolog 1 isoform X1 [Ahaetulla prasina]